MIGPLGYMTHYTVTAYLGSPRFERNWRNNFPLLQFSSSSLLDNYHFIVVRNIIDRPGSTYPETASSRFLRADAGYSQFSPCGHLAITDIPEIRTATKSPVKINYRRLTEINSRYY